MAVHLPETVYILSLQTVAFLIIQYILYISHLELNEFSIHFQFLLNMLFVYFLSLYSIESIHSLNMNIHILDVLPIYMLILILPTVDIIPLQTVRFFSLIFQLETLNN